MSPYDTFHERAPQPSLKRTIIVWILIVIAGLTFIELLRKDPVSDKASGTPATADTNPAKDNVDEDTRPVIAGKEVVPVPAEDLARPTQAKTTAADQVEPTEKSPKSTPLVKLTPATPAVASSTSNKTMPAVKLTPATPGPNKKSMPATKLTPAQPAPESRLGEIESVPAKKSPATMGEADNKTTPALNLTPAKKIEPARKSIPLIKLTPAKKIEPTKSDEVKAKQDAPHRTVSLRGRVVWLNEALARRYNIETPKDAAEQMLALESDAGTIHPIVEDTRGRAFRLDERLRDRPVEILARRFTGSPLLQVVRLYAVREDGKYELDYWCDICAIQMFQHGPCSCCQGENRLRERKSEE